MNSRNVPYSAIILAGGKGTRLLPYTVVIPKPMLPVGNVPIIEILSRQLFYYGFEDVSVSLGHLSGIIRLFLTELQESTGLPKFHFFEELTPLGTSGPIGSISPEGNNFLVINGDILTTLNLEKLYLEHIESGAIMTIAVRNTKYQLPFGSVSLDMEGNVIGFQEKPELSLLDNIGIYVFSRRILEFIRKNEKLDVNDLILRLLENKEKIHAHVTSDPYYWVDIGNHADYEKVNLEFNSIKDKFPFLPPH